MTLVIPDSISSKEHVAKLDELVDERYNNLNLSVLLVYLVNTVPASALPFLGEQFDVMGYKGWRYADTEQKKRDLIKKAIELHRYKGTPWSIKEALKIIGIPDAIIEEGIYNQYNGIITYNGDNLYGGGSWATFKVFIPDGTFPSLTPTIISEVTNLVLAYKNARSVLVGVSTAYISTESISMTEEFTLNVGNNFDEDSEAKDFDLTYAVI